MRRLRGEVADALERRPESDARRTRESDTRRTRDRSGCACACGVRGRACQEAVTHVRCGGRSRAAVLRQANVC